MKLRGARGTCVLSLFVCVACGGGEPPGPVMMPPIHITGSAPPPPQRARWVFAHPERGLVGKLDLGDGKVLYIGQNGRRELANGVEPLVDAPTIALGDLIGVVRDDKGQFAFMTSDGTVLVSKDPLGPLDVVRPGPIDPDKPNARLTSPTTGKTAMMGIHPDGRLMRSANFGGTWTPVDYAGGSKPYGRPAWVALDSKGNGVLVHFPQRLFVTHDDGATWAPLVANHMGVRSVTRDGQDRIFVNGIGFVHQKLDGNALVMTTDTAKPVYVAPPSPDPSSRATATPSERTDVRTILTGERVVEIAEITRHGKVRELEIGSAALGDKVEKPVTNTDLVGGSGLSKHIAGYGKELIYLRDDDDADATTATTTVFRSGDYGATWQKESQLQGVDAAEGEGVDVAAGPKGWLFVTGLCPKDETSSTSCSHRQVKPAGANAFEDMAFVEEFVPTHFAFDEVHDKVYALGNREGHQYVYESPLGQNKFSRTKLLEATSWAKTALTVDAKGIARAFEFDGAKGEWALHRLDETGKEQPPVYLAMDRGTIALSGTRGVIFASSKGWETNDGGETWMRIATNGYPRALECSDAGCINGDAQRVGWDLPAVNNQDKISATTEPTPPTTTPVQPRPPAPPPIEIACKVTGTPATMTAAPGTDMVDGTAADRWASVKHDTDSKISIVVGTKTAVRELPLLAALPKPPTKPVPNQTPEELRAGERVLPDGVVAARYRFAPRSSTGSYNPVDVELAWWSATTGRTQHKTLPKVPAFRVSRYGFSGTPQIVNGGLLFQGAATDAVYFIHDDGKIEPITLPKGASVREAERLPKRWVLADAEGGAVEVSKSDDNGKSWKQTGWGLDQWGSISLTSAADKATISLGNGSLPALLFTVDPTLPDDPPAPVVIDNSTLDTACDAHAGRHRFTSYVQSDRRPIRVRLDNVKGKDTWATMYSPNTRVMHDAGGKLCTSAYVMNGYDSRNYESQTVFMYPDGNGAWSGWRFRRPDDRSKGGTVAEQLTCK
jgi:hypothetical protein